MKCIILILLIVLIIFGCSDDKQEGCKDETSISFDPEAEVDNGICIYGGEGGQNTLKLCLYRATNVPIISKLTYLDSAYVKFNAINPPGVPINEPVFGGDQTKYDKIFTASVGDSCIIIPNLKKGKYFVYLTGYSDSLLPHSRGAKSVRVTLLQDSGETKTNVFLWQICCVF